MSARKLQGITGVILAGGASSRMGCNKALLLHRGGHIIEAVYGTLSELFEEVIVVTNSPELYSFLPCRKVPDLYSGKGVLAGIHSGLLHSNTPAVFTVACDMPCLNAGLIGYISSLSSGVDLVMPSTHKGFEPLHAIYRKGCLAALEVLLNNETSGRITDLLSMVPSRVVRAEEIACFDPEFSSFVNINTPDDYFSFRRGKKYPAGGANARLVQSL